MPVQIKSVKGYYHLDVWVMANIIQLSTTEFCRRFLNKDNDPCGRMFDQMTMAARSTTANIAEGLSRHQTSRETEMKLTDVARASMSELLGDFFFFAMAERIEPWAKNSQANTAFSKIGLDRPHYTDDWQREAYLHIMAQKQKFDPWTRHRDMAVSVNALMNMCNRVIIMLQKLIESQLAAFRSEGGFTENLTAERIETIKKQSADQGVPQCPLCGNTMVKRLARKGKNSGHEFWSCSNYPTCTGTRSCQ